MRETTSRETIGAMRKATLALVVLFACGPRGASNPTQNTTAPGAMFYCVESGQCFTSEADCVGKDYCQRRPRAWCAWYSNSDDVERFACAISELDCTWLLDTLHPQNTGPCVLRNQSEEPSPKVVAVVPVDASVDAAVLADAPAEPADAAPVIMTAEDPGPHRSVADELRKQGVIVTQPSSDDEQSDSEVSTEDGVIVGESKFPVFCVNSGKLKGLCFLNPDKCRLAKGGCTRTMTFACFAYTARTTGTSDLLCATTYGQCSEFSDNFARDPEYDDVKACAIFRKKRK